MLVLSRKKNEDIVIGDNVVVRIVDVRGDKVRVGVTAPPEVDVNRGEVAERKGIEIDRGVRESIETAARKVC